jgi:hypothetical protein
MENKTWMQQVLNGSYVDDGCTDKAPKKGKTVTKKTNPTTKKRQRFGGNGRFRFISLLSIKHF